jgi:ABC-type sugar transport system ATPase subunit
MDKSVTPLLAIRGLAKRFAGVVALSGVDFSANAGEVHALVGANGAGKSTLMNLVAGAQSPSAGEIRIDGDIVQFAGPAAAQERGIATVYQEFSLVPQLSVARNIFLGREPRGRFGLVDRSRLSVETRTLLQRFSLKLDADAEVGSLSVAEQQLVEIARALSFDARILILDEPTAVLSLAEQDNLFAIIRRLKAEGMLVLYVSHHLREVLAIADRVTVLRDGERVATRDAAGLALDELVELMIGRSGAYEKARQDGTQAVTGSLFRITYRTDGPDGRLDLRGGEIVGLAGLVGAGRTTFARALSGSTLSTASAAIEHDGRTLQFSSPREAMRHGVVYITEDRKRDGLFSGLDVVANATASALPGLGFGPFRNARREHAAAAGMLERLQLVASSLGQPVVKLSGGNQQKVLIGRALLTMPRLLICDEPTRGVDVGAKAEIHEILRELARNGVAVLVVSSEIEELLALAQRIVVMHERRFVAEMPADQADETKILIAASGSPAS